MVRIAMLFLFVGCAVQEAETVDDMPALLEDTGSAEEEAQLESPPGVELMDDMRLLFRASLDLRGHRPSIAEIEQLEADPDSLEPLIESFLQDEAFGEQIRNLYASIFLTRQDYYYVYGYEFGLDDEAAWARSVGEEALQILGYVAEQDLPYTELVTGDWTMANEVLGVAWPVDRDPDLEGWQPVHFTDERPAAGVLSTNSMWWRYMSNGSNANRQRANAISKIFLCTDYLSKDITFSRDINLLDSDAVNDALQSNPGCVGCHYSLDPIASYLWGFYYYDYTSKLDTVTYHPEREPLWESYTGVAPAYYGEPGYGLEELGEQIAGDTRFAECAVEQAWELLLQREKQLEDTADLTHHREAFLDGGLTLRSLFRSIIGSDGYRAAPTDDALLAGYKMPSPDLMAEQLEELTGYRMSYYGYDMMQTDSYGLRTLAGGVDGVYVTRPATLPVTTMMLVQERLAQAAAWYVAEQDQDFPEDARLFTEINFHETPSSDEEAMIAQIQRLHLRLFGKRIEADSQEVDANLELWKDLYAVELRPTDAWAGLLSVLLRDPDFIFY